jgi:hypothetical protein
MKNLNYFLTGILFVLLISAGTVSKTTVVPATPKSVFVKTFFGDNAEDKIKAFILQESKKGWILKPHSLAGGDMYYRGIVVMEKY